MVEVGFLSLIGKVWGWRLGRKSSFIKPFEVMMMIERTNMFLIQLVVTFIYSFLPNRCANRLKMVKNESYLLHASITVITHPITIVVSFNVLIFKLSNDLIDYTQIANWLFCPNSTYLIFGFWILYPCLALFVPLVIKH